MLIQQMREVKVLIQDIKEKMETVDVDEVLEKEKSNKTSSHRRRE